MDNLQDTDISSSEQNTIPTPSYEIKRSFFWGYIWIIWSIFSVIGFAGYILNPFVDLVLKSAFVLIIGLGITAITGVIARKKWAFYFLISNIILGIVPILLILQTMYSIFNGLLSFGGVKNGAELSLGAIAIPLSIIFLIDFVFSILWIIYFSKRLSGNLSKSIIILAVILPLLITVGVLFYYQQNYLSKLDVTKTIQSTATQAPVDDQVAKSTSDVTTQHKIINSPSTCVPNWSCTGFINSACVNGYKKQTCTDKNNCGVATEKPVLTQVCSTTSSGAPTVKLTIGGDIGPTVNVQRGTSYAVNWTSINATSCNAISTPVAPNFHGPVDNAGFMTFNPTIDTTYTIACSNSAGQGQGSITVNVTNVQPSTNSSPSLLQTQAVAATKITSTTAILNSIVGGAGFINFQWGTTTAYGYSAGANSTSAGPFSYQIIGLTPSTTYHFEVLGFYPGIGAPASYSKDMTFTTLAP